jgi:tRNA modification GTPase
MDSRGTTIDQGVALFFPGPKSFTGEDILELQAHGNPIVLARIVEQCVALGARVARPGEFSERAFLNDRIDLAQAEAIADLIDAGSRAAAQAAVRSLSGEFSKVIGELERDLETLRVLVEAAIDFPEEELDVMARYDIPARVQAAIGQLERIFRLASRGQVLREGISVVLVGEPNVGKSSLLNRLADDEVAIVTEIPGTTRDMLRAEIVVEGLPVHVVDTAGLRESEDPVERIGIERGRKAALQSDLALVMVDARMPVVEAVARVEGLGTLPPRTIVVRNKADLGVEASSVGELGCEVCLVSAKTGEGVAALRQAIASLIGWDRNEDGSVFLARDRHVRCLERALGHLQAAGGFTAGEIDLLAEELRYAEYALQEISGRKTPDDLLGEIFSRFCIGK